MQLYVTEGDNLPIQAMASKTLVKLSIYQSAEGLVDTSPTPIAIFASLAQLGHTIAEAVTVVRRNCLRLQSLPRHERIGCDFRRSLFLLQRGQTLL